LEDLPDSTMHLPIIVYSFEPRVAPPPTQPLAALRQTRGVEMLDNVVVGPGFPVLALGNVSESGNVIFSNNRCQQREGEGPFVPETPAARIMAGLLGIAARQPATVVLRGAAQMVVGNRVTCERDTLPSFSFSQSGFVTAVGNITSGDWVDVPATTLPTPTNSSNHINVP
jgi:hypothetical protein